MISHEYKSIFIHIPKCAGTTVEQALGHLEGHRGRGGQDHRTIRMIEPLCVLPILRNYSNQVHLLRRLRQQSRQHPNPKSKWRVSPRQYREYFKFTIVRNPWSRAVSLYANLVKDETHRQKHGLGEGATFATFLRRNIGKGMLRSQLDWIVDWRGSVPLDFIARFENLHEDFPKLAAELGCTGLSFDPAAQRSDLASWFDDDLDQLIRRTYRDEIEFFQYRGPEIHTARPPSPTYGLRHDNQSWKRS